MIYCTHLMHFNTPNKTYSFVLYMFKHFNDKIKYDFNDKVKVKFKIKYKNTEKSAMCTLIFCYCSKVYL